MKTEPGTNSGSASSAVRGTAVGCVWPSPATSTANAGDANPAISTKAKVPARSELIFNELGYFMRLIPL
jgi:hypothetical protein